MAQKIENGSDHPAEIPPAARLLGRELISSDSLAGEATLRFVAREDFTNRHGTVQGGMLAAMLDSATGNAVIVTLPPGMTAVTTRLDVRFLKPAAVGNLVASARVVRRDERSAEVDAELTHPDGQIVASARAELRIITRKNKS